MEVETEGGGLTTRFCQHPRNSFTSSVAIKLEMGVGRGRGEGTKTRQHPRNSFTSSVAIKLEIGEGEGGGDQNPSTSTQFIS